jgi:uncharacterized membrane protein YheB (UPF0754 family)
VAVSVSNVDGTSVPNKIYREMLCMTRHERTTTIIASITMNEYQNQYYLSKFNKLLSKTVFLRLFVAIQNMALSLDQDLVFNLTGNLPLTIKNLSSISSSHRDGS